MRSLFYKKINLQTSRSLAEIQQKLETVKSTNDWKILIEPQWDGCDMMVDIKDDQFSFRPRPRTIFLQGIFPVMEGTIKEDNMTGKRNVRMVIRSTGKETAGIYLMFLFICGGLA